MLAGARYTAFVLLLAASIPAPAQMFKWVDENGTVHYGSRCPEGVECSVLGSDPTPSQAEVEAARQRSEQLRELRQSRQKQLVEEAEERERSRETRLLSKQSTAAICESAMLERMLLRTPTPLYRDESGALRYRESLHDYYYQGARHYLDDEERARDLFTTEAVLAEHCQGFTPERFIFLKSFNEPPGSSEVIRMLGFPDNPVGPPLEELCAYARQTLDFMRENETGIPDDDMRQLEEGINASCQ